MYINLNNEDVLTGIYKINDGSYVLDKNKYMYHTNYNGINLLSFKGFTDLIKSDDELIEVYNTDFIKVYVKNIPLVGGFLALYVGNNIYVLSKSFNRETYVDCLDFKNLLKSLKVLDLFTDVKVRNLILRAYLGNLRTESSSGFYVKSMLYCHKYRWHDYIGSTDYTKGYFCMYHRRTGYNRYDLAVDLITGKLLVIEKTVVGNSISVIELDKTLNGKYSYLKNILKNKVNYTDVGIELNNELLYTFN